MVEEIAATEELDVTVYDMDTRVVGSDAFSATYQGVWHLSEDGIRGEIKRLIRGCRRAHLRGHRKERSGHE